MAAAEAACCLNSCPSACSKTHPCCASVPARASGCAMLSPPHIPLGRWTAAARHCCSSLMRRHDLLVRLQFLVCQPGHLPRLGAWQQAVRLRRSCEGWRCLGQYLLKGCRGYLIPYVASGLLHWLVLLGRQARHCCMMAGEDWLENYRHRAVGGLQGGPIAICPWQGPHRT